jgi:hypothetical protein
MHGVKHKKRLQGKVGMYYQCNMNPDQSGYDPDCPHPVVRIERLEQFVLDTIRKELLERGAEQRIREAIIRLTSRDVKATNQDEKKLQEVRRKIERGTENLALAGKDDFAAISKLLQSWRDEEAVLLDQIERRGSDLKPIPEAMRVISRFSEIRQNLAEADRVKLAHAIQLTVASITIQVRETKTGQITYNEFSGELRFREGTGITKPIPIPDEAIGHPRTWRDVGLLAQRLGRPLRLADVCEMLDSPDPSHASYHLRRAVLAGVVKKLPNNQGWVPAT